MAQRQRAITALPDLGADMGDPPGVDLDHLGLVGPVELPAEEELLTNPDVSVFHGLVMS
jgi:hypothetical protein